MTDIQQDLLTDILLEPKTASIGGRIGGVIAIASFCGEWILGLAILLRAQGLYTNNFIFQNFLF